MVSLWKLSYAIVLFIVNDFSFVFLFQFKTLDDLKLLANNQKFLESIKILVCWQIKFVNAIKELENGMDGKCVCNYFFYSQDKV